MDNKKHIVEVKLNEPYSLSFQILTSFCQVWNIKILSGGSNLQKAVLYFPSNKFKIIFGKNVEIKEYKVPNIMLRFINEFKVIK